MKGAGLVIWRSTAGRVIGVAAVAALLACEYACELVRTHGVAGWSARLVSPTLDGLICASSMALTIGEHAICHCLLSDEAPSE